jgi:hypothetical protein
MEESSNGIAGYLHKYICEISSRRVYALWEGGSPCFRLSTARLSMGRENAQEKCVNDTFYTGHQ